MIIIGDNGRPNDFPDSRIHWIFGCFGTLSVLANIMFLFLPKHKLKNCIESVQMGNTYKDALICLGKLVTTICKFFLKK